MEVDLSVVLLLPLADKTIIRGERFPHCQQGRSEIADLLRRTFNAAASGRLRQRAPACDICIRVGCIALLIPSCPDSVELTVQKGAKLAFIQSAG